MYVRPYRGQTRETIPDHKDADGLWVTTICKDNHNKFTKSFRLWSDVKQRCDPNSAVHKKSDIYHGVTMSDKFKNFQFFAEWCNSQIGYNENNYHLDKDLLLQGNRQYGEDVCCFVPAELNTFYKDCKKDREVWPLGVCFHKATNKFCAKVQSFENGRIWLGLFGSPAEASSAYKIAKEKEARNWAIRLSSGGYKVDPRVIERMRVWTLPEHKENLS